MGAHPSQEAVPPTPPANDPVPIPANPSRPASPSPFRGPGPNIGPNAISSSPRTPPISQPIHMSLSRPGPNEKDPRFIPTGTPMGSFTPPSSLREQVTSLLESTADNEGADTEPLQPAPVQIETVPTTFRWAHGGQQVFVTGSFNDWQGKFLMPRSEDNPKEFVLVIDIPPGEHQYKYIVDDQWRLDPDVPTCVTQGIVNNTLDVKRPVFEDTRIEDVGELESDDEFDENKQPVLYGQKVPSPDDYVKDPMKIPPHLSHIPLNAPPVPIDPYFIPTPSHVSLNHLYCHSSMMGGLDGNSSSMGSVSGFGSMSNVTVTAMTQRFKLKAFASLTPKFVTTVYYAPKR